MASPDPLKNYRVYLAMFLLNLAVVVGIIYFQRRENPRPVTVTLPTPHPTLASPAQISVAVNGAVKQPGVYALGANARLADAIQKAGGASPDADLSTLDLTTTLTNGEQIEIPARTASVPVVNNVPVQTASAPANPKVNLNTATLEELEALPDIGPALAQRIIDYRKTNGSFKTIADVKQVRGIGDAIYSDIQELISVQ